MSPKKQLKYLKIMRWNTKCFEKQWSYSSHFGFAEGHLVTSSAQSLRVGLLVCKTCKVSSILLIGKVFALRSTSSYILSLCLKLQRENLKLIILHINTHKSYISYKKYNSFFSYIKFKQKTFLVQCLFLFFSTVLLLFMAWERVLGKTI